MAKKNKRKRVEEHVESAEVDTKTRKVKAAPDAKTEGGKLKGKEPESQKKAMDDFDDLFASKKERIKEEKEILAQEEKREEEKRAFFRKNNESSSSSTSADLLKNAKKKSLTGDRNDTTDIRQNEWVDDGRGGVFDSDGFTGRKEEGVKVFKAHLFNRKGFGNTKDCPFDCDCCFI